MGNWMLRRVRRSFDSFGAAASSVKMNSMRRGLLVLILMGGLLAAHCAMAQVVNGSISGSVVDGGNSAVADAKVTLVSRGDPRGSNDLTATTDKYGHFHIHEVPPGIYSVA